jgi:aldose 1-epimerase
MGQTSVVRPVSRVLLRKGPLSVGLAPECGGALTRCDLRIGKHRIEILRQASDEHINRRSPYGASCFPLIPYASRLREGKFEFRGRNFVFPINAPGERHSYHGDGWTRAWNLIELSRSKAVLELAADPSAPIQYDAIRTIEVDEGKLTIKLSIRNRGAWAIPVGLGVHPYFARRHGARIFARLPVRWRMDDEILPIAPEANPQASEFQLGLAGNDLPASAAYSDWDGHAVIEWPSDKIRVRIETTPRLRHVIAWAPPGEEFFCFEPVSHATNSFNLAKEQIQCDDPKVVEPGETCEQTFDFLVGQI